MVDVLRRRSASNSTVQRAEVLSLNKVLGEELTYENVKAILTEVQ